MEFTEEIEALQFTFPEDITWDQAEGEVLVRFTSDGHKLLTLHLTRSYPSALPNITVYECPDAAGIQRRLERYAEEQVGSPMLYGIVDMLKEHVGTYGEFPAEELARDKIPSHGSSTNEDRSTVCKFQGKCKCEDKCLQQHASRHKPQNTVADEGSDKKGTARKEPKTNDSLHPIADEKPKKQKKSPNVSSEDEDSTKKTPMRQASDVISRILWDPDLPAKDFTIGYLDRFLGILEKPFSDFSWEDISSRGNNVLAVPQHRIQYFKYKSTIVWDKRCQLDDFFGSRGGKLINDFVDKTAVNTKQAEQIGAGTKAEEKVEDRANMSLC